MSAMHLYTFRVDVTPPLGDYICGGLQETAIAVEAPLELRGVILSANSTHYVLAAIDYCYLVGLSQRRLEEAIACGADIPPGQVTVHSVHVHDAPLIHEGAHRLIEERRPGVRLHNETYFADVLRRARDAVASALAGDRWGRI